MVSYKELGLVNTREMFAKAIKGGYAVPAFNFNNMEQLQAIIKAAAEDRSPVILQVSKGARNYANATLLRYMAQGAVEYAKELGWEHPQIVLHLDHGDSFELCKSCIDNGFSSVMIDGSHLPYEENVALTKQVVDYAHHFASVCFVSLVELFSCFSSTFFVSSTSSVEMFSSVFSFSTFSVDFLFLTVPFSTVFCEIFLFPTSCF